MTELKKATDTIYAMWLREMLKFSHAKGRIIGALMAPLAIMLFLGPGLINGFKLGIGISFFAPGLIAMTILFASLSGGISIIWDREFGILKGILVTPVSRLFIVLGKTMGDVTIATIQGILIIIITIIFGVRYDSIIGILASIIVMFLTGVGFIGLGVILGSKVESHEEFQMVMSFLAMPLIMLSGAFFPISDLPIWLKSLVYINPLTYDVEALRWYLSGSSTVPISISILIMTVFAFIMIRIAGKKFEKMRV